ncbi:MAG: hypothetical protein HFF80_01630 [Oscillospiraceae bacterium]|jgi:beta-lactamase regulating signal transducer with metallopeptidase domain|nr:hypothetical protein [Oscillospiraceae bacterium]
MKEILLTSSFLILALSLLRRLLRGRISPTLQYALWLLVAARLLIPGSLFPSPVSVVGAASNLQTALQEAVSDRQTVSAAPRPNLQPNAPAAPPPPENISSGGDIRRTVPWPALVWGIGAGLTGTALAVSNLAFAVRLHRGRKRMHLPPEFGRLPVYLMEGLVSPCLFGLLRPAVYVNEMALEKAHFVHILVHEQTHFRHGDHLWAVLRGVCLTVYWFNPLVWLAAALSRRDCELACDDGAIRRLGEEKRLDYGATLLRMVPAGRSPADLLCTATTMTAGKRTMKERISLIAHRPRMLRLTLAAVALLICCLVAVTFGGRAAAVAPDPAPPANNGDGPADDPTASPVEPAPSPAQTATAVLLENVSYLHPSGLFSLAIPEPWLGAVLCVQTEDGAAFYDADRYQPETEDGWLMSVVPTPTSWADTYHRNDYILEGFDFNGSPYVYVLDINQETELADEQYMGLFTQAEGLAGSFRLRAGAAAFPRLIHDNFLGNMPLAVAYLPYLRWSDYRDIYGEDELSRLLEALYAFIRDNDVSWGQVHDILSNRFWDDPTIDGAYATGIQEGILWQLYEKDPQRFVSVLGSVYLTEDERAGVVSWLRFPLSDTLGRTLDAPLTDTEIYQLLGIAPSVNGVTANFTDVTLRAAGESFQLLPVGTAGIYAVTYASSDASVAAVDSSGTVTALSPGRTVISMHFEGNAGQQDFSCTVRCVWDGADSQQSEILYSEEIADWETWLEDYVAAAPASPGGELYYDSMDELGLDTAISRQLHEDALAYLGGALDEDLLNVTPNWWYVSDPDLPSQVTVRYVLKVTAGLPLPNGLYSTTRESGELEATFSAMSILNAQNMIRFDAMARQHPQIR